MWFHPLGKMLDKLKIVFILFFITSLLIQNAASLSQSNEQKTIPDQEKYIVVKKSFTPSKEFYSIGDEIRVCVEIKNDFKYVNEPFFNAKIYEIVDQGLNITTKSDNVYKISNVTSLIDYYNSLSYENPIFFLFIRE